MKINGKFRGRGFTLIELLVVVAVIAGLIAILVPSLSQVRQRAQMVACSVNMRTLSQLDNQYAGENNGFIPRNSGSGLAPSIAYLFLEMQRVPLPARNAVTQNPFESNCLDIYRKIKWLQCPAFPNAEMAYDYVTNGFNPSDPAPPNGITYLETRRVHRPSELINFTEANTNFPTNTMEYNEIWHRDHLLENRTSPVNGDDPKEGRIATDKRHGTKINISYFDTHVDGKEWKKVTARDFTNR